MFSFVGLRPGKCLELIDEVASSTYSYLLSSNVFDVFHFVIVQKEKFTKVVLSTIQFSQLWASWTLIYSRIQGKILISAIFVQGTSGSTHFYGPCIWHFSWLILQLFDFLWVEPFDPTKQLSRVLQMYKKYYYPYGKDVFKEKSIFIMKILFCKWFAHFMRFYIIYLNIVFNKSTNCTQWSYVYLSQSSVLKDFYSVKSLQNVLSDQ